MEAVADLPLTAGSRAHIARSDVYFAAVEYDLVYLLVTHRSACGAEGCDVLIMRKTGEEWVVADRIRAPFDVVGDLAVAWLDGEVRTFRRDPGVSDDREAQEVVFPIKDALGKAYPPERIGERWELSDLFVGYADLNRDGRDEILYYITNPSGACDREHACGAGVLSQVPENYYPKRRLGVDDSWADLGGVVDDYWPCEPDTPDCRRLYIIERDGRSDLPYHGLRGAWQSYELKVYYYLPSCWPGCL